MAQTYYGYIYNGTNSFTSPIYDENISTIKAYVNEIEKSFTQLGPTTISLDVEPNIGDLVEILRYTQDDSRYVDFTNGSILREQELDLDSNQLFNLIQESRGLIDQANYKLTLLDTSNFNNNLSLADTTIQKAFDTLDNLTMGAASTISVDTTSFDNNLSSNEDTLQKCLNVIDDLNINDTRIVSDGNNNFGTGVDVLKNLPNGSNNTAVGNLSLGTEGTSEINSNNVAVGFKSGYNQTGDGNAQTTASSVFIGYEAGLDHEQSNYNCVIGTSSGTEIQGDYNVILGNEAGKKIQSNNNVVIGSNANSINSIKTFTASTLIGFEAGRDNISGSYSTLIGQYAGRLQSNGQHNIGIGYNSIGSNVSTSFNIGIGNSSLKNGGTNNVALGHNAGSNMTSTSINNVAIGNDSINGAGINTNNTAVGFEALGTLNGADDNIAIGYKSGYTIERDSNIAIGNNTFSFYSSSLGGNNVAIGHTAMYKKDVGDKNTALGNEAMYYHRGTQAVAVGMGAMKNGGFSDDSIAIGAYSNYNGSVDSVCIGSGAGYDLTINSQGNIAIGFEASRNVNSTDWNCVVGYKALTTNTNGTRNTALGTSTLADGSSGGYNTAVGHNALRAITGDYNTSIGVYAGSTLTNETNTTCVGANSTVTGSNQVQLGDSATTTYAYGAVQDRSDMRDKADIRDTELGLEFINKIRPRQFKWDFREDYFEIQPFEVTKYKKETVEEIITEINDNGEEVEKTITKVIEKPYTDIEYKKVIIEKDGSKKRNRYHNGVIAQEVKAVMDEMGVDFGGYQDHSLSENGKEVMSIGYEEFISPLIKAVQELTEQNKQLQQRIEVLEGN